jgi:predicted NBD/HSP70 family sugar kinase
MERVRTMDIDFRAEAALDAASHLADALLRETGLNRDDVLAVAASIPGPLDGQRRVISSPILSSRIGFAAADELASRLGKPVDIENDADMGRSGPGQHATMRTSSI